MSSSILAAALVPFLAPALAPQEANNVFDAPRAFAPVPTLNVPSPFWSPQFIGLGDWDGDGDDDALISYFVADSTLETALFANTGSGFHNVQTVLPAGLGVWSARRPR